MTTPSGFKFSNRSKTNLAGVHPKLVAIVTEALNRSPFDFIVVEGLRTKETQARYLREKRTRTMDSYHITGHAIDIAVLVDGKVNYNLANYKKVADVFKEVAKENKVSLTWGGDWKSLVDGPHFQIAR